MWADCTKAQCLVPAQKFLCKTNQDTQARLEGLEEFESGLDGVGKGHSLTWCVAGMAQNS